MRSGNFPQGFSPWAKWLALCWGSSLWLGTGEAVFAQLDPLPTNLEGYQRFWAAQRSRDPGSEPVAPTGASLLGDPITLAEAQSSSRLAATAAPSVPPLPASAPVEGSPPEKALSSGLSCPLSAGGRRGAAPIPVPAGLRDPGRDLLRHRFRTRPLLPLSSGQALDGGPWGGEQASASLRWGAAQVALLPASQQLGKLQAGRSEGSPE